MGFLPCETPSLCQGNRDRSDRGRPNQRILLFSENKRDLPDLPDYLINTIQLVFYADPTNAAVGPAMRLE